MKLGVMPIIRGALGKCKINKNLVKYQNIEGELRKFLHEDDGRLCNI